MNDKRSLSLAKIEAAKKALIAIGKQISEAQLEKDPISVKEAHNKGMIKVDHLKANNLYYGYSTKVKEAIWNEKERMFYGKDVGINVKLKYFTDFIPMVDSNELEYQEDLTLEELQKEYQNKLIKYSDAETQARKHIKFRDECLIEVHQMRKRFEDKLKETELKD